MGNACKYTSFTVKGLPSFPKLKKPLGRPTAPQAGYRTCTVPISNGISYCRLVLVRTVEEDCGRLPYCFVCFQEVKRKVCQCQMQEKLFALKRKNNIQLIFVKVMPMNFACCTTHSAQTFCLQQCALTVN